MAARLGGSDKIPPEQQQSRMRLKPNKTENVSPAFIKFCLPFGEVHYIQQGEERRGRECSAAGLMIDATLLYVSIYTQHMNS